MSPEQAAELDDAGMHQLLVEDNTLTGVFDQLDTALIAPDSGPVDLDDPLQGADHANRLLRALRRTRRQIDHVTEVAAAERDRIDTWEAGKLEQLNRRAGDLEEVLHQYHRAVLARDPKAKTIELPNGVLSARAQQPDWEIDVEVFVGWAVENAPGLLTRTETVVVKPDRAAIKKALSPVVADQFDRAVAAVTSAGEVVPGVTVSPRPPRFNVDPT